MKINPKLSWAVSVLILAMLACNLPSKATEAAPTSTEQATQAPTAIPTFTSTSEPAATPTPSTPTVSVSTATNCRTGPGPNYNLVLVFQPGATAPVIAKYSAGNYWIITTPTGGTCWLWGAYATVQGNTSALAEMAPPAAPPTQVVVVQPTSAQPDPTDVPTKVSSFPTLIIIPPIIKINLPPAAPTKLTVSTNCLVT